MNGLDRAVFVVSSSAISIDQGNLVIRKGKEQSEETRICLDQVGSLFVESPGVNLSSALLLALGERNIPVLVMNGKHQPSLTMLPLFSNGQTSGAVYDQLTWKSERKQEMARVIVKNKLELQRRVLASFDKAGAAALSDLIANKDLLAIEGVCAKHYFSSLFGKSFVRGNDDPTNAKLNYGYAILASMITCQIVSHGFLCQLGIHHHCEGNPFNLTYDFIEPFRPIVDEFVKKSLSRDFNFPFKLEMAKIREAKVHLDGKAYQLKDAITE